MKTTSKISVKPFHCEKHPDVIKNQSTNHYGQTYSFGNYNKCPKCTPMEITVWICNLSCPEGMSKPENWKTVKLGDIYEIVTGK